MSIVITITAKRNGFRRCGVTHSDKPTTYQQDDFTDEQWEALVKEPQLVLSVQEVDLDPVEELPHDSMSQTALSQALDALPVAQSQASETVVASVAAPVVDTPSVNLDSNQPGPAAPGADDNLEDHAGPLMDQHQDESSSASSDDQPQPPADAPAKGKGKTSKPTDESK